MLLQQVGGQLKVQPLAWKQGLVRLKAGILVGRHRDMAKKGEQRREKVVAQGENWESRKGEEN